MTDHMILLNRKVEEAAGAARSIKESGGDTTDAVQCLFKAVADALTHYGLNSTTEHLRPEWALMVSGWLRYLERGQIPELFLDCVAPNAPGISPPEERAIRVAVAYVGLAKKGIEAGGIFDAAPVKRVADEYKVTTRTVQTWCQRYAAADNVHPQIAESLMARSAEIYKHIGHSAEAIKTRNKKGRS